VRVRACVGCVCEYRVKEDVQKNCGQKSVKERSFTL
jgi:hypothetical protein